MSFGVNCIATKATLSHKKQLVLGNFFFVDTLTLQKTSYH